MDRDDQERLVAAFEAGEVAGVGRNVERVDTHLSHVFLTPDRAFKLKRAVVLPFVDFRSVEARRAACEAELKANRQSAGALYLGVAPIVRRPAGALALGGEGDVIDWVVVMRRFDRDSQFDHLARAGDLTRELIEQAAGTVAALHASAPRSAVFGHAVDYRSVLEGLIRTEADGAVRLGLKPGARDLFDQLEAELSRQAPAIEDRRKAGKARRGHGDLHLRNICLFSGCVTLFDALEFDERLATADVLYDFAFLLMDLRRIGSPAYANAALNRYWDASGEDEAALGLLPAFMGLRAAVRMAVAVEAGDLAEAQTYRTLGLQLLEHSDPVLVAVGGLSGAGKSAVARSVAPLLPGPAGARILRSDVLRKRALGLGPGEPAPATEYQPARREAVYRDLFRRGGEAMRHGASVVGDATFQSQADRERIGSAAQGGTFLGVWLDLPLPVRLARIAGRASDVSDADVKVAAGQRAPASLPTAWRRFDADRPVEEIVSDIMGSLPARRPGKTSGMSRGV